MFEKDEKANQYDNLTRLPVTAVFMKNAEEYFRDACEKGMDPAMIYFDLEGLRPLIARYGEEEGERKLKAFAELLRKYFGDSGSSRSGGFCFYAFADNSGLSEDIPAIINDMRSLAGKSKITVKAGVYNGYKRNRDKMENACEKAKFACLNGGTGNTSGIFYFDSKMDETMDIRSFVVENIDSAIKNGDISVYYQSQVRLLNDKYCGAEALTRWEDPFRGNIEPSVYVQVLEENNLTWKLDTFVIREIAANIKRCSDMGLNPLPIAVNLTYADFLVLDVPETVSGIVHDTGIETSLIVIEVTERTVLRDPELLKSEIERLHAYNISVVIDDFGNGYSSINMLSDFRFSAVKVDMELMRSFNERSRKIVESVVVMAKSLKIHTISEGVETREQVEFLRSIGCEIVQGFYYGGLKTFDDTIKTFKDSRTAEREGSGERELFAEAGLINIITEKAMALTLFDGETFDVFFANNEFYRIISRSGHEINEILNGIADPAVIQDFREAAKRIRAGGKAEDLLFSHNSCHFRLDTRLAAVNGSGAVLLMYLSEDRGSDEERESLITDVSKDLLASFNNIYLVDLENDSVHIVKSDYGSDSEGESHRYESVIKRFLDSGAVYDADLDRYSQFFDPANIRKRFSNPGRGAVLNVFRMKINGVYKWASVRLSSVPGSGGTKVVICITIIERESQADFVEMSRQVMGIEKTSDNRASECEDREDLLSDGFLWNSLMEISDVKYFWKDNDRRFLGASKSFLEFYGFDSVHEILGKNDEEMGWHPDDTQYRSDEFEVIEKGAIIHNSPGQIYAKGARVNILATKYPIYKNGRIEGLIGYFIDTDTVLDSGEELDHALFMDMESGLMNSRGFFLVFRSFDDNYRISGEEYGIAMIEVAEYKRIYVESGKEEAENLARKAADTIRGSFSENATVAKTGNCTFMVCDKGVSSADMEERLEKCIEEIKGLYTKHGLTVSTALVSGGEKNSMQELFLLLLKRLKEAKEAVQACITDDEVALDTPDVFKDMPLPFIIVRPVMTLGGTADVKFIFANNRYCEYSGLSRIDLVGKSYKEFYGGTPDWLSYAGRASNGETVTGRVFEASFGQWMEYIATPSSVLGCCNLVFWPVEDTKNERDLLTRGHAADNAIIRIARFLNTGDLDKGINKSLSELGRVLNPARVYMLAPDGAPMHEWCADGVLPRKNRGSTDFMNIDLGSLKFAFIEESCIVVDDTEVIRKIDPKAYEFLASEGISSYIVIPLFDNKNDVMGFVGVDNFRKNETAVTRRLLEEISYFISARMVATNLMNRLNIMSNHDELTGLLNRHGYHTEMEEYLSKHPDDPFTLVLIDIDDFKIINDMYGHITGDEVLRNLAADLNDLFKDNALIARTGGDELSVAVIGAGAEEAERYIRELSESEHGFMFEGKYYTFRMSIGYSCYPDQSRDLSLLLRQADSALYYVKSEGKHSYRQFGPEIKLTKRLQLAFNVKNVARYVPGAILVYEANDDKKILYANEELITMFECSNMEEFMEYTGGTFDGIVHPEEIQIVDDIIWAQIDKDVNCCKDYVDYRIITKNGNVKEVIDCGRYVESEFYGSVFYVMLLDKDEWRRSKGAAGDE
ncbi:MAG: EAL domain-containing protein [Lachnospiraceae bacterium]|nr:EAL domain-containing protein [Lachnospiraceae bacterium]